MPGQHVFPQSSSSSSFVYPIKSLLTNIQPAADRTQPGSPSSSSPSPSTSPDISRPRTLDIASKGSIFPGSGSELNDVVVSVTSSPSKHGKQLSLSSSSARPAEVRPQRSQTVPSTPFDLSSSSSSRSRRKSRRLADTNFSHYPADGEDPNEPRCFARNPSCSPSAESISQSQGEDDRTSRLAGPFISPPSSDYNSRRPPPLPLIAQSAFAAKSSSLLPHDSPPPGDLPLNPSELGIVHLPSIPSLKGPSRSSRVSKPNSASMSRGSRSSDQSSNTSSKSNLSVYLTPEDISSGEDVRKDSDKNQSGDSDPNARVSSLSSDSDSAHSSTPIVTVRFQYAEDEHGHHVVVGREGKLTRCEDEPIRTPGSVQGFGVLIAVEELEDVLLVRQVSENATQLLGLSPQYLFGLECFTDILPDSQAQLLWDNIQFLCDPSPSYANPSILPSHTSQEDDSERDSPHVFLLSGYGAPGTAQPGVLSDPTFWDMHQTKRRWTCWCAIHRPQASPYLSDLPGIQHRPLIIMEFELEHDALNPLYPPPIALYSTTCGPSGDNSPMSNDSSNSSSDSASGSSGSDSIGSLGAGNSTDESEKTLVSGGADDLENTTSLSPFSAPGAAAVNNLSSTSVSLDSDVTPPAVPSPTYLSSNSTSTIGPLSPYSGRSGLSSVSGMEGDESWVPSMEEILESTTSRSKPLLALERLRRLARMNASLGVNSPASPVNTIRGRRVPRRSLIAPEAGSGSAEAAPAPGGVGMMDVFAVMAQINEQLGAAPDLDTFLKVVVGVIKDLTQFHRVLVYQFDEMWNGQTVAELVDWSMTHDLYKGLHFPASDIPAQARELYTINKVRILYDRDQPTARIVVRNSEDLQEPLNMTHCYLRAMSPIHIKYLGNMGVRASMSVSIMAFGTLWGLVACHSYGPHGMRVSFPVRQMLRLLSQSISRNIERLSYAQRLHTRKLINTISSDNHPTGYIVSNADDLLGLFDADFGILVIGDGAKILGPNQQGQEILIMAEYLRLKQFNTIQVSQAVTVDFPDLNLSMGLEIVAGLLYVPLSSGGKDFIAFLRKGQPRDVHWAGKPFKAGHGEKAVLEPRKSFRIWSETVAGRCRTWTDEQLETAGVLALVYGKFIEVWRQKENALRTTKLTNLLLSNASHEVRTPLNHIINYLEMALNGPLDLETRDNLSRSHAASKSLLFTINDLLDLTRLESGNETSFNEPFDIAEAIQESTCLYRNEASRRDIDFHVDVSDSPQIVIGDAKKIRTVVQNLTANALKYTTKGSIAVQCKYFNEPEGLRHSSSTAVEITVADTGCGIPALKLESIFREFEQVESSEPKKTTEAGVGLGLAVVARIVEQLGGQLRVESKVEEGSTFSFLIPLTLCIEEANTTSSTPSSTSLTSRHQHSRTSSMESHPEIDSLVEALSSNHMNTASRSNSSSPSPPGENHTGPPGSPARAPPGTFEVVDSQIPVRPIKVPDLEVDTPVPKTTLPSPPMHTLVPRKPPNVRRSSHKRQVSASAADDRVKLRVLIVEDNDINRLLLAKRLRMDGHTVVNTTNGQEGLDKIIVDRDFDCVLMDINMPILNGFESSERIREVEKSAVSPAENADSLRLSHQLNGRIPIFAVSASLYEDERQKLSDAGMDGWILKPIDFKRLAVILKGVTDLQQRELDRYYAGCNWEAGGWLAWSESSTNSSSRRSSVISDRGL